MCLQPEWSKILVYREVWKVACAGTLVPCLFHLSPVCAKDLACCVTLAGYSCSYLLHATRAAFLSIELCYHQCDRMLQNGSNTINPDWCLVSSMAVVALFFVGQHEEESEGPTAGVWIKHGCLSPTLHLARYVGLPGTACSVGLASP